MGVVLAPAVLTSSGRHLLLLSAWTKTAAHFIGFLLQVPPHEDACQGDDSDGKESDG